MSPMRTCIYCNKSKPPTDFSEEHIIPRFLGGSSEVAELVTHEVCQRCNSLFGRYVDAAVAKGYFSKTTEQGAWEGCFDYDAKHGNVYPLTYIGKKCRNCVRPR